ncbi:uncharacterized protein LOC133907031 [Phragmites australis]|uniref:uncharacterized protein LOC133907031 n=1 Tax=Phragmites australis TaxID=29695 RepID=UPI002D77AC87|nr:uncharacterized protein LOC133907031 [Phragmites australis]XP_062204999.1 uncharacterized protein LOC133907031 [Phragmites australis]
MLIACRSEPMVVNSNHNVCRSTLNLYHRMEITDGSAKMGLEFVLFIRFFRFGGELDDLYLGLEFHRRPKQVFRADKDTWIMGDYKGNLPNARKVDRDPKAPEHIPVERL